MCFQVIYAILIYYETEKTNGEDVGMSKICVLAEKPSVGRDIARVLNCTKKGNGFLEGDKYIVTWALGHLVTLADPEKYGGEYQEWRLDELPILPEKLELVVIRQTTKQFHAVKAQLRRPDVTEIVIATDAGREGELVARWILEIVRPHKTLKRLWISSVTDKAIREGFAKLRDGRAYENLYHSATARAASDWYVGINATRALTCKFNAQLSCGRVQTPTLAMIAAREKEISDFVPEEYYGLAVHTGSVVFTWQDKAKGSCRSFQKEKLAGLEKKLGGQELKLQHIERKLKRTEAPLLYDLTSLQTDANRLFGYSAKETLSIMQKLYETHKILTYPRTDSRYLTADIVPTIKERLNACGVGEYSRMAFEASKRIKASKHFVDDARVSDHHAIIPTEQFVDLRALSEKEHHIYDLVVRRFLAVLYPAYEYEQTTLQAEAAGELFIARGRVVRQQGWQAVYHHRTEDDEAELEEQILPAMDEGSRLKVERVRLTTGRTKPPARFTEGTLLAAMENPAKFMAEESKELKETLGRTGGIGTVATRADIIEKLFATFLLEKKGKDIYTTAKGRQLLELVPEELRTPALTAKWEQQLAQIAEGSLPEGQFLSGIKKYAQAIVGEIKDSEAKFHHDNLTRKKCPECGKFLLEVNGKHGKMLVCQDRACGYRKALSRTTNARCPNCHKKMEMRGEGDGKMFVCACGYREKLTAFQKRRAENSAGRVSKREVSKYLHQQEDDFKNNALAEALAGLKLGK